LLNLKKEKEKEKAKEKEALDYVKLPRVVPVPASRGSLESLYFLFV